ncbi:hypothetical protein RBLE17_09530 [Rhodobacteraceae bacterium LE17]|jgi:hypothetical protein|nr:hypothetical protein [Rhodobacteraceae bacterium LE17]
MTSLFRRSVLKGAAALGGHPCFRHPLLPVPACLYCGPLRHLRSLPLTGTVRQNQLEPCRAVS